VGKGGRCVRLTTLPPSCAVVTKSGNLNFLALCGPVQACNGTALHMSVRLSVLGTQHLCHRKFVVCVSCVQRLCVWILRNKHDRSFILLDCIQIKPFRLLVVDPIDDAQREYEIYFVFLPIVTGYRRIFSRE